MKGEKNLQSLLKRDIILSIMTRQKLRSFRLGLSSLKMGGLRNPMRRM